MSMNDGLLEKLSKLTRSMLHGAVKDHPDIYDLLKEEKLIFTGEEVQPIVRFIPEARKLLDKYGR